MRLGGMGWSALALGVALGGCDGQGGGAIGEESAALVAPSATTLNTFVAKSLEIDEQVDPSGTSVPADDANEFVGADPADGTPSEQKPAGGPASWIDWSDLATAGQACAQNADCVSGSCVAGHCGSAIANHLVGDCPGPITAGVQACSANGKDPTSFPESNTCVGASSVLSKMDITYVGFSNNNSYAYATVQRSDNSGDAGWYWLFTRNAPTLGANGSGGCKTGEQPLTYNLTGSANAGDARDVLLAGHFHPSSAALVRVFRARKSTTATDAVSAIDYTDATLWEEVQGGVANAAVNTTPTDPGAFGWLGVDKTSLVAKGNPGCNFSPTVSSECLGAEIVTEAAVPISVFTGGAQSACGVTFYGSVITRSSGSGGTTPDLKDLAGPAQFVFGNSSATATLLPTCAQSFQYYATVTDAQGNAIASPTCSWTFKDASGNTVGTSSTCGTQAAPGTFAVPGPLDGPYTASLSASDPNNPTCGATVASNRVNVYPPLSATPTMTATCSSTFGFSSSVTGGSGSVSYAWTFGGACGPATTSSTAASGGPIAVTTSNATCTGSLVVTDARSDVTCTASGATTAKPLAPLGLALVASPASNGCPSTHNACSAFDDSGTFTATGSGGSGSYTYTWTGSCAAVANVCTFANENSCCNLPVSVALSDNQATGNGVNGNLPTCAAPAAKTGTYSKLTTVSATVP